MAVKHIFLAILSQHPMHGYELKNMFEKIVSEQWQLNFGQVYTTLTRMERDGLVTAEEIRQEEKPDKKTYNLTAEGYNQLSRWLEQKPDWNVFHDELSFQLAAFELIDRDKASSLLEEYRVYLVKLIKELIEKKAEIKDENSLMIWIFERNIGRAEADLKWVESYRKDRSKT